MTGKREQAERTRAEVRELVPWLKPRQLAYWIEMGWIRSDGPQVQGHPRAFSPAEKRVLRTMARLVQAGFGAQRASFLARTAVGMSERSGHHAPGDDVYVPLGDGLLLLVEDV